MRLGVLVAESWLSGIWRIDIKYARMFGERIRSREEMIPLYSRLPEVARAETRSATLLPGNEFGLPPGE